MKATVQKIPQRHGWSWRYKMFKEVVKPEDWHVHQEFELVLHRNFQGKSRIAHFEGLIEHNELLLLGPEVAHSFESINSHGQNPCEAHVIWFSKEWIAKLMYSCVELRPLASIIRDANKGVKFSTQTAEKVFQHLNNFDDLTPIGQLAVLIQVLGELCADQSHTILLSYASSVEKEKSNYDFSKIAQVCKYIDNHYSSDITLKKLADYMYVSENTVHRWFIQHFNESYISYLTKLRLNHACQLLTTTLQPISLIAENVGYTNRSNFNRSFKKYKGMSPSLYRKQFK
ncbi:AraC family transcriptional regulator [Vibrio campbellii]|uniref:Helix-turn-helix transcriptional regulator n=1 Tax=Vibrio campbellii TaxID=680 RepID=A0ABY5INI9_9VIBR|nr:AraC family transcriptional regulator [Vibrio campbellii]ARV75630.1 AraC family transcriptional regulator [Vibrio campbellii CAIM 519 = NBRC 15631 = ATCC 25920]ELU50233.1 AraC family transcriptional regulator [Vibrio campbellii CAIM 519 = NBRC 15631 = ATCC 25920]UTZ25209.1 helix-turn-helix transcriptional regulator [Vibrio campbellii]UTZ35205.1 helix-turn-helix transcriptional regulator [Vibrio campbellii]HDM8045867.1 helix-turn-helix domain-containing protein [Vibrio campbellii]